MREFKYTPQLCQGEDAKFSGHVVFDMPGYADRKVAINAFGIKINEKGELDYLSIQPIELQIKMFEFTKKHVRSVELEHKATGEKFQKFEDLEYSPYCDELLEDLGSILMNGIRLGK